MIHIIGEGVIPEAQAFHDVRDALKFDRDVYLCSHIAPFLGIELKDQAIYNLEPLYDGCRSLSIGYMEVLKNNHVIDYDKRNVAYLKSHGIEAFYMPYGYHKSLERPVEAVKDIDFLLVGSVNERRERILKDLHKYGRFEWVQGVYGQELDWLIARAKVHLNVHFCDDHPLEVVRLNYLMANGCNVVSERGNSIEVNGLYCDGLHFADDVIERCLYALRNPKNGACVKLLTHECTSANDWLNNR